MQELVAGGNDVLAERAAAAAKPNVRQELVAADVLGDTQADQAGPIAAGEIVVERVLNAIFALAVQWRQAPHDSVRKLRCHFIRAGRKSVGQIRLLPGC